MKTFLMCLMMLFFSEGIIHAQKFHKVWESSSEILKTPESVLYDEDRDVIFVSNINGEPMEKDGNGFISILNHDGSVKTLNWVEGLNAPKGMAIYRGILYVADIDKLVAIDIGKEKVVKRYPAPGAVFLNDVAASKDGMIFVSDTRTAKIYALKNGKFNVWLESKTFENPNGLLTDDNQLYVGDNNIYKVDIPTKKIVTVIKDAGGVDGLEKNDEGDFVYSNWPGKIWINKKGKNIKLHDSTEQKVNTADIDYVSKYNLVLVPTFYDNRVIAYRIE